MTGTLAVFCAVGAVPVWCFTGQTKQEQAERQGKDTKAPEEGFEV